MRIAITASGPTLDANVDPRFGRCAYFLFVDTDTLDFEAVENSNIALGQGAGIQSAQLVVTKGAQCVLTGDCGPNAHDTLSGAGIGVIPGCSGAVRDVIEKFSAGQFNTAGEANVASQSARPGGPVVPLDQSGASQQARMHNPGMGMGRGRGGGAGGRGMGRGMGKGMGRGGGQGRGRGGGGMGQGRGRGRGQGV